MSHKRLAPWEESRGLGSPRGRDASSRQPDRGDLLLMASGGPEAASGGLAPPYPSIGRQTDAGLSPELAHASSSIAIGQMNWDASGGVSIGNDDLDPSKRSQLRFQKCVTSLYMSGTIEYICILCLLWPFSVRVHYLTYLKLLSNVSTFGHLIYKSFLSYNLYVLHSFLLLTI